MANGSDQSAEPPRYDARRQQLYLKRVVDPTEADAPTLPHRARDLLVVFITTLLIWSALALIISGVREQRQ